MKFHKAKVFYERDSTWPVHPATIESPVGISLTEACLGYRMSSNVTWRVPVRVKTEQRVAGVTPG